MLPAASAVAVASTKPTLLVMSTESPGAKPLPVMTIVGGFLVANT